MICAEKEKGGRERGSEGAEKCGGMRIEVATVHISISRPRSVRQKTKRRDSKRLGLCQTSLARFRMEMF